LGRPREVAVDIAFKTGLVQKFELALSTNSSLSPDNKWDRDEVLAAAVAIQSVAEKHIREIQPEIFGEEKTPVAMLIQKKAFRAPKQLAEAIKKFCSERARLNQPGVGLPETITVTVHDNPGQG